MFKTLDEIDKDGVENPTVDYSNAALKRLKQHQSQIRMF